MNRLITITALGATCAMASTTAHAQSNDAGYRQVPAAPAEVVPISAPQSGTRLASTGLDAGYVVLAGALLAGAGVALRRSTAGDR